MAAASIGLNPYWVIKSNLATLILSIFFVFGLAWPQPLRSENPSPWAIDQIVGQFHVNGNSAHGIDPRMIAHMQKLEPAIVELLKLPKCNKLVHVVLFDSESEYRRYMQHYFPSLPRRRALFIQDRGPGMVFAHVHPDLGIDLRHECVHALLNNYCASLPLWLDEGLAEYFEVEAPDRMQKNSHLKEVKDRISSGLVPSLLDLESIDNVSMMGSGQYRDSWAWVHFLLHRQPATRAQLIDYLSQLAQGEEPMPLSKSISLSSPQWQNDFIQHFQALDP